MNHQTQIAERHAVPSNIPTQVTATQFFISTAQEERAMA